MEKELVKEQREILEFFIYEYDMNELRNKGAHLVFSALTKLKILRNSPTKKLVGESYYFLLYNMLELHIRKLLEEGELEELSPADPYKPQTSYIKNFMESKDELSLFSVMRNTLLSIWEHGKLSPTTMERLYRGNPVGNELYSNLLTSRNAKANIIQQMAGVRRITGGYLEKNRKEVKTGDKESQYEVVIGYYHKKEFVFLSEEEEKKFLKGKEFYSETGSPIIPEIRKNIEEMQKK